MGLDVPGPCRLREATSYKPLVEHGAKCHSSDAASLARERTLCDLSIAGFFLFGIRKAGVAGYRRGCLLSWLQISVAPNALRAGRGMANVHRRKEPKKIC